LNPENSYFKWCLLFLSIIPGIVTSQISFEVSDTVCINDSVIITNTSREATTYYWNFCSGNLFYDPGGENFPDPATLNGPAFIDFAEDEDGYYAFITNHSDGTITRYFYGHDFLSPPVAENLGNFGGIIPDHVQGVQVVQDDGQWYAFIVGGQREESRLVRLDFGNSLSNTPAAVNLGNVGAMDYPIDLYIFQESGEWIGFTANFNSNTITQFNFNDGLANNPTAITFGGLLGLNQPAGIFPIFVDGNWYMFVSNYGSNEIIALDFGYSLASTSIPSGRSIGNNEYLYLPADLTILRDCERTFGFVLNRLGDIVRMDFDNGIDSIPEFTSLGEVGNLYNPQGISDVFRVGDTLFAFVANIDNNSITRLFFPGCNNASVASSTDRDPPPITYNAPGNYNISLVINEGLPDQENYCQNVTVLESPEVNLGNDTIITIGTTITLDAGGDSLTYEWLTGETTRMIDVDQAGTYWVRVTNEYGCTMEDEIVIDIIIETEIPNFFTPNNDLVNDTWEIEYLDNVPDALIQVFDRFGNLITSYRAGEGAWDGEKNGEPVPEDTYWYVIKINNETKPLKGSVTIVR
jgi:gliding motility-associated-like protein